MCLMKNFRITYQPFAASTVSASDVIIPAKSADDAQRKFEARYPQWGFVEAKEEL